nr:PhoX family phosphatase [Ornithinicoccus halotolerans]
MTATPVRRLLPLLPTHPGGRSAQTCHFRCGDQCAQPVPNTSGNRYFGDVLAEGISRRSVVRAGALGAAVVGLASWGQATPAAARPTHAGSHGFTAIDPVPSTVDAVTVPEGYRWEPVASWGDPVLPGAPAFDFDAQTPEAQRQQFGYNCDYVAVLGAGNAAGAKAVMVVNHEYTNDNLMFRDYTDAAGLSIEQLEIIMAAHGMSVVEVRRQGARRAWRVDPAGRRNRRIHTHTELRLDGPAAGSEHLRTSADPTGTVVLGTLNNCAGGTTPWGTVLSGEENFHQYFNATGAADPDGRLRRYGITGGGRGWERADSRFLVAEEPNEVNRHGWIVEVDPEDPTSAPVKHTALGRFKHEGATVALAADGRAVAYMGDDERYDYLYKFVSAQSMRRGNSAAARRHNLQLLAEGDLYVARFTGDGFEDGVYDGTGEWLPLVLDGRSQVPGFTVAEVLVWTRLAADTVGATKMDRPEDVEPNPANGRVYAALTNNTRRTPGEIDEANPRANNRFGHVIEIDPDGGDHASRTFGWNIVLVCGDPEDPTTYYAGFDKSDVSPISCPDNVAFDREGNLWISTDGQPGTLGYNDGLFMMPVDGDQRGNLQQFLAVPVGAETCGPVIDPTGLSVLVAVQHPGEVTGASPDTVVSQFPYLGDGQPRPGVIHVVPQ